MKRKRTLLLSAAAALLLFSVLLSLISQPLSVPVAANRLEDIALIPRVPSTPRDFILPGTQPDNLIHLITPPQQCVNCHAGYSIITGQPKETETWTAWAGSMMAQAGRDPLFYAALDVANGDAAHSGEFCLRCHLSRGWLEGRSSATDGSAMTPEDLEGVQCAVCHRMVDPVSSAENPARDSQILADLQAPVSFIGSGSMVIDPEDYRRGPFDIISDLGNFDPHKEWGAESTLISPYHQESAFCGTCHDINNPMFTWDEATQEYKPNPLDQPGDADLGFPIERTFSEWRESAFNSKAGVYAPQFGGNKQYVSTCQDCHMRDITGVGGVFFGSNYVTRDNMPLHDLTGANTWVPQIIPLHPVFSATFKNNPARADALNYGVERARYMLKNAAALDVYRHDKQLVVTVANRSGHKLPSGYVEGRRMWLQVEGYDATGQMIYSSGKYDQDTGVLQGYQTDPALKVYEVEQGLTTNWATQIGLPPGPSFHFALNNQVVNDNRIPPLGYTFEAFDESGAAPYTDGQPDPNRYQDGQFWDTTFYDLPDGVVRGVVRLLYQTASKEYIEFLRDENPYAGNNNGAVLYDLWQRSSRSQPELMAEYEFGLMTARQFLPALQRP